MREDSQKAQSTGFSEEDLSEIMQDFLEYSNKISELDEQKQVFLQKLQKQI